MERWRRRALEGLEGTVIEIGSGSGLNLALYPDAVDRVYAVEPSEVARRLAERAPRRASLEVTQVALEDDHIDLPHGSCDAGVSTFVLCTVPDPARTLREVSRVLRVGGSFHFLEHGRSPDVPVRRWQERFDPLQQRLAGGCHLTRDVRQMVTDAGLRVEHIETGYARGPKPWTWFSVGSARRMS
jgi:SAM-dependent methyltransferase